jgi:hypothetical protein
MRQTTQNLKELYEKDFYLWVMENLRLLKSKEYELVDWENLLEEIEDMGQRHFESMTSQMARIMEHLYKWENFRYSQDMGHDWIRSINDARDELEDIFKRHPSLEAKAQEKEVLQFAWDSAVSRLIRWLKEPRNDGFIDLYFKGETPTKKDFPQECPYTFQQIMEYEPWIEEFTQREPEEPEKNKSKNKRKGFEGLEP